MTQNQIAYWNYRELQKQNRIENKIKLRSQEETERANRAREMETMRTNVANENLRANELLQQTTHNNLMRLETQRSNMAREQETTRSNQAREGETRRINTITARETERSHRSSESISSANNYRNYVINQRNADTQRMSQLTQSRNVSGQLLIAQQKVKQGEKQLAQQERYNIVSASQKSQQMELEYQKLLETTRHNEVSEYLNAASTALLSGLRLAKGGR